MLYSVFFGHTVYQFYYYLIETVQINLQINLNAVRVKDWQKQARDYILINMLVKGSDNPYLQVNSYIIIMSNTISPSFYIFF